MTDPQPAEHTFTSLRQDPYIVITHVGRMSWTARVQAGLLQEANPAFAFTRKGAERKGRRRLARWVKRRNPEQYVIRAPQA